MSNFKKPAIQLILFSLVCFLLIASNSILGSQTGIASALTTYQVTFAVSGSGSTSPSGLQTYNASQQVPLTATPSSGFAFVSWSVSPSGAATFGNASSASTTATITGTCTITATFIQATYQVGFAVNGSGSTNPSGTQTYNSGVVVSISATPGTGYSFSSWSVSPSGAVAFGNASSTSTWAIIYGNCNITAIFAQVAYQVTFAVTGSGSTSPSGVQSYLPGQQQSIAATADPGFVFAVWGVSPSGAAVFDSASSASTIVTIHNNCTVTASFIAISPTPSPSSSTTVGPSSSPNSTSGSTPTPVPTNTILPSVTPSPTPLQSTPTPTPRPKVTPTPNSNQAGKLFFLPLTLIDVSLFFAVLAIVLVPTSKLLPRYYQMVPSLVRKLEVAALVVSSLFLLTAAWQVLQAIIH